MVKHTFWKGNTSGYDDDNVQSQKYRVTPSMVRSALPRGHGWNPQLEGLIEVVARKSPDSIVIPATDISAAVLQHSLRPIGTCQYDSNKWDHEHIIGFDATITLYIYQRTKHFVIDGTRTRSLSGVSDPYLFVGKSSDQTVSTHLARKIMPPKTDRILRSLYSCRRPEADCCRMECVILAAWWSAHYSKAVPYIKTE
jgi:hypothetical protein